jgi:hypothetical protein
MTKVIDLVDDLKRAVHQRETTPKNFTEFKKAEYTVKSLKERIIKQVLDEELD